MHIHIAELNDGLGKELPFSFATAAAEIDAVAADYAFQGPIEVTGTVTNTGAGYRVARRRSMRFRKCSDKAGHRARKT